MYVFQKDNKDLKDKQMKSFIIILLLCVFGGSKLFAQKTEFVASAPSVVEVGEQFRLSFVLNAKGENLQVPTIKGFDLLAGPSLSTSSNITRVHVHLYFGGARRRRVYDRACHDYGER